MTTRHNDDYIPTFADIEHERDERLKRLADKPDPENIYLCKYTVDGMPIEEKVAAVDTRTAEEKLIQQCSMVGWIPRNIVTTLANEDK